MTDDEFQFVWERNSSLQGFRPFYPDRDACYADYAQRMIERYARPRETCDACAARAKLKSVEACWEIAYQNKKSLVQNFAWILAVPLGYVVTSAARVGFSTSHGLCRGCRRRVHFRRMGMILVAVATSSAFGLAMIMAAISGLLFTLDFALEDKVSFQEFRWTGIGLGAAAFFWFVKRRVDVAEVPAFLRAIAKRPVRLRDLK